MPLPITGTASCLNATPPTGDSEGEDSDQLEDDYVLPTTPHPITFEYGHQLDPVTIPDDAPDMETRSPKQQYLAWHYRLNHMAYLRMDKMIAQGLLPQRLAKADKPICYACLRGKATR